MICGFCAKRIGELMTEVQGKQINICLVCNKKWQFVKEDAS